MPKGSNKSAKGDMSAQDMFDAAMKHAGKSAVKIHKLKKKNKKQKKKQGEKVRRLHTALSLQINENLLRTSQLDEMIRRLAIMQKSDLYNKRELAKGDVKILELFDQIDFLEAESKSWEEFAYRQIENPEEVVLVFSSACIDQQQSLEVAMADFEEMKKERDDLAARLADAYSQLSENGMENGLYSSVEVERLSEQLDAMKAENHALYSKVDELEQRLRSKKHKLPKLQRYGTKPGRRKQDKQT